MPDGSSDQSHPFILYDLLEPEWEIPLEALFQRLSAKFDFSDFSEIALTFVDPEQMRELNRDYRGKDKPTDILTFHVPAGEGMPSFGDIFLCTESMQDDFSLGSTLRVVLFLVAHGALHLLGFTHETEDKLATMIAMQKDLIGSLQVE